RRAEIEHAAAGEVNSAFLVLDQVIEPSEPLTIEAVCENLAIRLQCADRGGLLALIGLTAGICAGALHYEDSILRSDGYGPGTVAIGEKHREPVVFIELTHSTGLFLSKQHAAVARADDAIGIVGALPGELPFCAHIDDARNG